MVRIVKFLLVVALKVWTCATLLAVRVLLLAFGSKIFWQSIVELVDSPEAEKFAVRVGQAGQLQFLRGMLAAKLAGYDPPEGFAYHARVGVPPEISEPIDIDAEFEAPAPGANQTPRPESKTTTSCD